jgi:hypothetical protein
MSMRVYIGWDAREQAAFDVAAATAMSFGCMVIPLYEERLRVAGMLSRPVDRRGQYWDLNSNAPQATEFANARFWVPLLAHSGWVLFMDGDTVTLRNPGELKKVMDPRYAVMVVKHMPISFGGPVKMDGQVQTIYPRKLWSSVMLYNCDHPANRRLNLQMLNSWPGRDLHAFKWLADDEIGELSPEWNWLVGLQPKPLDPAIVHYTLGTPDMPGLGDSMHADIWYTARQTISSQR